LILCRSCAWVHVWKAVLPNLLFGREEGCSLRWSYVSTVLKFMLRTLRLKNDSDRISALRVWNVRHLDAVSQYRSRNSFLFHRISAIRSGVWKSLPSEFLAFLTHKCYMFICYNLSGSSITFLQPSHLTSRTTTDRLVKCIKLFTQSESSFISDYGILSINWALFSNASLGTV
jgi:hypothetical protein